MLFPSRHFKTREQFVEDFLQTLTPGIIPRRDFIDWDSIESKLEGYAPAIEFYTDMPDREVRDWFAEIRDSILADNDPISLIGGAFQLLGHTDNEFVSLEDDTTIEEIAEYARSGNEIIVQNFVELLEDIGFANILSRAQLSDLFFGIQIGLETHRRKNLGGKTFVNVLRPIFEDAVKRVNKQVRKTVELSEEKRIPYGVRDPENNRSLSKKVDFLINYNGNPRFGIEANFYTTTGSKPTEIKRSYGNIRDGLKEEGVDLVWVTDGKGYRRMDRSLRDAYAIIPNIYNLKSLEEHFADDLLAIIKSNA